MFRLKFYVFILGAAVIAPVLALPMRQPGGTFSHGETNPGNPSTSTSHSAPPPHYPLSNSDDTALGGMMGPWHHNGEDHWHHLTGSTVTDLTGVHDLYEHSTGTALAGDPFSDHYGGMGSETNFPHHDYFTGGTNLMHMERPPGVHGLSSHQHSTGMEVPAGDPFSDPYRYSDPTHRTGSPSVPETGSTGLPMGAMWPPGVHDIHQHSTGMGVPAGDLSSNPYRHLLGNPARPPAVEPGVPGTHVTQHYPTRGATGLMGPAGPGTYNHHSGVGDPLAFHGPGSTVTGMGSRDPVPYVPLDLGDPHPPGIAPSLLHDTPSSPVVYPCEKGCENKVFNDITKRQKHYESLAHSCKSIFVCIEAHIFTHILRPKISMPCRRL